MAKDDYFVIIYQILKGLYEALKSGKAVTAESLTKWYEVGEKGLNATYWSYILDSLSDSGYIQGLEKVENYGGAYYAGEIQITPKGIEYLFDNSTMSKIKNTIKEFKDILPLILNQSN